MFELRRYIRESGVDVVGEWLRDLRDRRVRARIEARLTRLELGHFGDCKPVGAGVWELRIDFGAGYRVYYAMEAKTILILLCGGDKHSQQRDIQRAIKFWQECQDRS